MSRAVLHRKFEQATSMSPIRFIKSMRLNYAAMNIATGMTVNTEPCKSVTLAHHNLAESLNVYMEAFPNNGPMNTDL